MHMIGGIASSSVLSSNFAIQGTIYVPLKQPLRATAGI
jgi:hypothetical protein